MLIPILLSLAFQSAAAPAATEPSSEIVVQGVRVGKQQLRDFVKSVTDVPYDGQIPRFHASACPVALGLTAAQNAAVAHRMRQIASAAGIGVAPAGCNPNVFVIAARDKKSAIDELDRRYPVYFSGLSSKEVRRLASSPEPAVAWQVRSLLTADGQLVEKSITSDSYRVEGSFNPSRIRAASKPTFVVSVVVIDIDSAAGLTTTELADYAAMRTFAATDPERVVRTGVPTILGILGQPDDKPLPVTLTYWDLGLLKALYSTDNAYYATHQRSAMERVVKDELEEARPHERE
jgi:hypothetical protein